MKYGVLLALFLTACGGGGDTCDIRDSCEGVDWKEKPQCVPPIPLPCTFPCARREQSETQQFVDSP